MNNIGGMTMSLRIDSNRSSEFLRSMGILYSGTESIKERGFKIGDKVQVGASYSEPEGIIVGLDDQCPDHAQVKLVHRMGSTTCWIKSEHLAKKES